MAKQRLSPAARRAKAARDKAAAMTPERRRKKAENQRRRRANPSAAKGKDWDHNKGKFVSVKVNRGGHGKGTKKYNTK